MTQVFISYSRKDLAFVERLAKDLKHAGFDAWYDLSGLEAGKNWGKEIQAALETSQFMIVILSPSSLESRWVEREYLFAESLNLKVIPLLYQPCRLPLWTIDLHYIDLTTGGYRKHLAELLKVLGKPEKPEPQKVPSEPKPALPPEPVQVEPITEPVQPEPVQVKLEREILPPFVQPQPERVEKPKAPEQGEKEVEKIKSRVSKKPRWWYFAVGGVAVLAVLVFFIGKQFGLIPSVPVLPNTTTSPTLVAAIAQNNTPAPTQTASVESTSFPIGTVWPSPKDLAYMVYVPKGEFTMGGGEGQPQFIVYLDDYWIDSTEVTIGQYEQCIAANACEGPLNNRAGSGNFEAVKTLPESGVSWKMAEQYCTWVGERLPTEAEWEKAARGTDKRTYPWGEGISKGRANYGNNIGDITHVGSYQDGKSPYGAYDMAGNVMEWVADWYWDYPTNGETLNNPTGPESGTARILRGGSYPDIAEYLTTMDRKIVGENEINGSIGFRCAMSVPDQMAMLDAKLAEPPAPPPGGIWWAPSWTSPKDVAGLLYIQAGKFTMGSDSGSPDAAPAHEVYLSGYWIDEYEVTNDKYFKCQQDKGCQPPLNNGSYTRTDYYLNPDYAGDPAVWVTWEMAQDYCKWAGRRLPTEAEWEKAARGPYALKYPWGMEFNGNVANAQNNNGDTTHVGAYKDGMSGYGASDMAGNVWEWVADFYDENYYSISPGSDPKGPDSGETGIIRGGCFLDGEKELATSFRMSVHLGFNEWSTGFRCAVTNPNQ